MAKATAPATSPIRLGMRIALTTVGGFALTTGLVAIGALALPYLFGVARSEAALGSAMAGFIAYLVFLLWGFSAPRLSSLAKAFGAGSALALGAAWALQHLIGA